VIFLLFIFATGFVLFNLFIRKKLNVGELLFFTNRISYATGSQLLNTLIGYLETVNHTEMQ
jgi:hypothetical protein